MSDKKSKIGSITVHGPAQVGDYNEMNISMSQVFGSLRIEREKLNVENPDRTYDVLTRLTTTLQDLKPDTLSVEDRARAVSVLKNVLAELNKVGEERDQSRLGGWLDDLARIARGAAPIVALILELRKLVGL